MTFDDFINHGQHLAFKAANTYYLNFDPCTISEKTDTVLLLDSITSNASKAYKIDLTSIDALNQTIRLDGMKVKYEVIYGK